MITILRISLLVGAVASAALALMSTVAWHVVFFTTLACVCGLFAANAEEILP